MAIMKSKLPFVYDAELALRAPGSVAVTATAATDGFDLGLMAAYWNKTLAGAGNEVAAEQLAIVVDVTAVDPADADETYTFHVQTDSVADFSDSPINSFSIAADRVGTYVILLDVDTLRLLDADGAFVRLNLVIAGTTPSITYSAWVHPVHPLG